MRTMNYDAKRDKKISMWMEAAKDGRLLDKFAWWPVKMNNDSWVWLERYVQNNRYMVCEIANHRRETTGECAVIDTINVGVHVHGPSRWHSRKDIPETSKVFKLAIDTRAFNSTETIPVLDVNEFYAATGDELK
jgi:hypothetical protein